MTVRLHIERLVVDGLALSGAEADVVRAALEAELTARLAAVPPGSWTGLAVPTLTPDSFAFVARNGAASLGRQVAAALHGGLKP